MLKTLRNPQKVRVIMFATLILIIPAFVIFYGWSQLTGSRTENLAYAAKVNGTEISSQTFYHEYEKIREQARKIYGDRWDEEAAKSILATQVLDELENREIALQEAKHLGITVPDYEIYAYVQEVFQSGGKFDRNRYIQTLLSQGMTPEIYENDVRIERLYQKIQWIVTDFVKISEPEIREEFRKEFEKITLDVVRFSARDYLTSIKVDDKEAETFYSTHKQDYQIPPQYRISYLTISPQSFDKNIQINEKDIKDYYNNEISSFILPDRLHLRQIEILLPQNASAQQQQDAHQRIELAYKRVTTGESFEKVAKEMSDIADAKKDGGDIGWVKRGEMEPNLEKLLFSIESGKISQVLQSQQGYLLFKVEQKETSRTQTVEEVKVSIISTLRTQGEDSASYDLGEKIYQDWSTLKDKTQGLQVVANKYGYSLMSTSWFSADNLPEPFKSAEDKNISSDILTLTIGKVTEPIKTSSGYHLVELTGREDSRIPKFEEVVNKVKARLMVQKAQELAQKNAADAETQVKSQMSLEGLANKFGTKITTIGPYSVLEDIPGIGQNTPLAVTAFYLPEGKTSGLITVKDPLQRDLLDYYFIRVKSRSGTSDGDYMAHKDEITQKVLNQKRQQVFSEWIQTLRKRAKIQVNQTFMSTYQTTKT